MYFLYNIYIISLLSINNYWSWCLSYISPFRLDICLLSLSVIFKNLSHTVYPMFFIILNFLKQKISKDFQTFYERFFIMPKMFTSSVLKESRISFHTSRFVPIYLQEQKNNKISTRRFMNVSLQLL